MHNSVLRLSPFCDLEVACSFKFKKEGMPSRK